MIVSNRLLLSLLTLLSCSCTFDTPTTTLVSSIDTTVQTQKLNSNSTFELVIEQKKINGEIIPIGPKGVTSISIDGYEYPINKLVTDQLIIEIPNLISGKHELLLSLYLVKDEFKVPLVIPNISQKIFVVLRLTVNESKRELTKIEYGYDLDQNGILDNNAARFESLDAKTFYAISTDGIRRMIDSSKSIDKTVPDSVVLPPGVVPSSGPQKNDTTQPQIQLPEPPKPKTNDLELYPLPPSASRLPEVPIPLPSLPNKKNVPEN